MKTPVILLACVASLAAAPPIVIQNATVLTVTKGTFQGSVLIRDGKIAVPFFRRTYVISLISASH